jgi:hypothetical protein
MGTRSSLACCALFAAACASPAGTRGVREDEGEARFDRVIVEPMLIPGAWLQRDTDGGAPRPEQVDGAGAGLRAALGKREQSIGVLFQSFRGDDDRLDVTVFFADFDARTPLEETGNLLWLRAGGGFGAGWLDSRLGATETDLAGQLRVGIDVQPVESFALGISIGGLLLGHPGETEAYGAFVTLSALLTF